MGVSLPRKDLFEIPEGYDLPRRQFARGAAQRRRRPRHAGDRGRMGQRIDPRLEHCGLDGPAARRGRPDRGLIGAPEGSVATGDTLSIKVYQALAAALKMRPDRRVILSDSGNFPTDLYMAQGLIGTIDKGYELRTPAPEDVAGAITEDVAAVMLTHVDYRTGRMHDMAAITEKAHAAWAR